MKQRESVIRELESIEGKLAGLKGIVKTSQPIRNYLKIIGEIEAHVEQISLYVENER